MNQVLRFLVAVSICSGGFADIYVAASEGGTFKAVTNDEAKESRPSWSPDSSSIVYSAYLATPRSLDRSIIYVHNLITGVRRELLDTDKDCYDPCWSPDGKFIVYAERDFQSMPLFVCDADGGNKRCITKGFLPDSYHFAPRWSPVGDKIVFCAQEVFMAETKLCIVSADGSNPRDLGEENAAYFFPEWSRDGTRILCNKLVSGASEGGNYHYYDILEYGLQTREFTFVVPSDELPNECYEHCPVATYAQGDSAYMVTACYERDKYEGTLYRIARDSEGKLTYAEYSNASGPADLYGLLWSPDQKQVVCNFYGADPVGTCATYHVFWRLKQELDKRFGQVCGGLLLGAHGELYAPAGTLLGHPNKLVVRRKDGALTVTIVGYGEKIARMFFRVSKSGAVELINRPAAVDDLSQLPSEWPALDAALDVRMPDLGSFIFKREGSSEERPAAPCEHWFVLMADRNLFSPPEGTQAPPNVLCLRKTPSGMQLTCEGPAWSGVFAEISHDRTVTYPDQKDHPPVYWPYVDENGALAVPPKDNFLSLSSSQEDTVVVTAEGYMGFPVGK